MSSSLVAFSFMVVCLLFDPYKYRLAGYEPFDLAPPLHRFTIAVGTYGNYNSKSVIRVLQSSQVRDRVYISITMFSS